MPTWRRDGRYNAVGKAEVVDSKRGLKDAGLHYFRYAALVSDVFLLAALVRHLRAPMN